MPSHADKENNPPLPDLEKATKRGDNYQKEVYNARNTITKQAKSIAASMAEIGQLRADVAGLERQISQFRMRNDSLVAEVESQRSSKSVLAKQLHSLKQKIRCIPDRIGTAINKTKSALNKRPEGTFNLKEKGVVPDTAREMINDLVALEGVRPGCVTAVLQRIAAVLGIKIDGDLSRRSVQRTVKEGGIASQLQFVEAVVTAKGVTLSSDGTTHKNINLESRRATVIGPNNQKQNFFLGIESTLNHTSETQLQGWEEVIDSMYAVYKTSSRCETADDARDFWCKVTGWHTNHAPDQKKLFRLAGEKKSGCEWERRGEKTLIEMVLHELLQTLFHVSQDAIASAGGLAAWDMISKDEQRKHHNSAFKAFVQAIGQAKFDKLSPAEQQNIDLFIWGGCCMHKNMNIFKAGCRAIQQWWIRNNIPGPIKLYNRDNVATVTLGEGTSAATWAEERSCSGAIKSHAAACEVIVLHMDLLLQFLVYVKENKGTRTLNHMEANVDRGLCDWATHHDFVAIALMNQNHNAPYLVTICGLHGERNLLNLGEFHQGLKAHLRHIIYNPKLITSPDATYQTATLDGKPWTKPEVMYACLAMISRWELMHVNSLPEWEEDGVIARLTPEEIKAAFLEVTNDGNESELGIYCQGTRSSANMTLAVHNSLWMYKANHTSGYLKTLSSSDRQLIRVQVRNDNSSGHTRAMKHNLVVHMKQVADSNAEKDDVRAKRVQAAKDVIAKTTAINSVEALDERFQITPRGNRYLMVIDLDLQLNWQILNAVKVAAGAADTSASGIPKAKSGPKGRGNRETRYQHLRGAILQRLDILAALGGNLDQDTMQCEPDVAAEDKAEDDGYDSEEAWVLRAPPCHRRDSSSGGAVEEQICHQITSDHALSAHDSELGLPILMGGELALVKGWMSAGADIAKLVDEEAVEESEMQGRQGRRDRSIDGAGGRAGSVRDGEDGGEGEGGESSEARSGQHCGERELMQEDAHVRRGVGVEGLQGRLGERWTKKKISWDRMTWLWADGGELWEHIVRAGGWGLSFASLMGLVRVMEAVGGSKRGNDHLACMHNA
ncbi:hypothetical protein C8J57DRAFT_1243277 [Mycena rebaudengoi]|nr:hypothetical protein C8J57DRAFT_1243277 [Mycena rebaudengoi]